MEQYYTDQFLKKIDLLKKKTSYNLAQQQAYHNLRVRKSGNERRFTKNRPVKSVSLSNHEISSPQDKDSNLPNLHPINVTACDLTDGVRSLLSKEPAFCPAAKDVNWQKTIDDL